MKVSFSREEILKGGDVRIENDGLSFYLIFFYFSFIFSYFLLKEYKMKKTKYDIVT